MDVYKILSQIMDSRDLSIADVARICGLPDSTVRGIIKREQKTIALDVAFKLSDGLNVSLEQLNGMATENAQKKTGAAEAAPGEDHISNEESERLLLALGLIKEGQHLSDDDLAFLTHIIGLLEAWFSKIH